MILVVQMVCLTRVHLYLQAGTQPGMAYYEVSQLEEPDYFMMDYYSYKSDRQDTDSQTIVYLKKGTVYSEGRKYEFIGRVQRWLKKCIKDIKAKHPDKEIIFGFAPGHSPSSSDSFMITELDISSLCSDRQFSVRPKLLQRFVEAPKQATTRGKRNIETHLKSIRVTDSEDLSGGKIVCIMDDIWTTGCTLSACTELVRERGAEQVYTLAIGKTVFLD